MWRFDVWRLLPAGLKEFVALNFLVKQSVSLVKLLDLAEMVLWSLETSVMFYQSTRHNIQEDSILQLHCTENRKSRIVENILRLQEEIIIIIKFIADELDLFW
jgi:hypothetical protein